MPAPARRVGRRNRVPSGRVGGARGWPVVHQRYTRVERRCRVVTASDYSWRPERAGGGTVVSPPLPGGTQAGTGDEGAGHRQGGRPCQQRQQREGGESADGESTQRATVGCSLFQLDVRGVGVRSSHRITGRRPQGSAGRRTRGAPNGAELLVDCYFEHAEAIPETFAGVGHVGVEPDGDRRVDVEVERVRSDAD